MYGKKWILFKSVVEIKNNGSIMGRSKLNKINCLLIDLVHIYPFF